MKKIHVVTAACAAFLFLFSMAGQASSVTSSLVADNGKHEGWSKQGKHKGKDFRHEGKQNFGKKDRPGKDGFRRPDGDRGQNHEFGDHRPGQAVILKEIVPMVTGLISSVQMGSVLTSRDRKVSSIIFSGQILMDSVLAWVVKGPTWDICLKGQGCPKICVLVGKNL